jgi:hypothetical protein
MKIGDRYRRVSRLSGVIQWIIRGALIFAPVAIGLIFALDYFEVRGVNAAVSFEFIGMKNQYGDPAKNFGPVEFVVWGPLTLLVLYAIVAPLYHFDRLLTLYCEGTYFAAKIELHLRRIGQLLVATQILSVLYEPTGRYLLYLLRNRGGYTIELSLEFSHVVIVVVALFVIVVAYLMGLAHEAMEEAEFTI